MSERINPGPRTTPAPAFPYESMPPTQPPYM